MHVVIYNLHFLTYLQIDTHTHNLSPQTKELELRKYIFHTILTHIYIVYIYKHIYIAYILQKRHFAGLPHVALLSLGHNSENRSVVSERPGNVDRVS